MKAILKPGLMIAKVFILKKADMLNSGKVELKLFFLLNFPNYFRMQISVQDL